MNNELPKSKRYAKLRNRNYKENKSRISECSKSTSDSESEHENVKKVKADEVIHEHVDIECIQQEDACKEFVQINEDNEEDYSDGFCNRFSSSDESNNESECSDNSDNDKETQSAITNDLRRWARESLIFYKHVDSLLKILKKYHPELPLSHKTLLKKTSNKVFKVEKFNLESSSDNSEFVYCGIAKQLQRIVDKSLPNNSLLNLQFNIDGLPLYHSSSKEFWPILGKLHLKIKYRNLLL